jgi:hypothetical protein
VGVVPPTPNFAAGEFPAAAKMNQLQTALNFLMNPPRAVAFASAAQNHPTTATFQSVALDGETLDTDGIHDLVTSNSRMTIQTPGKYIMNGQITFATNATGRRAARIIVNNTGGGNLGQTEVAANANAGTTTVVIPPIEAALVAGDFVEMQGFQTSGAALAYGVGTLLTFFRVQWIGL